VRRRKRQLVEMLPEPVSPSRTGQEFRLTIHEELSRLPEKYQLPVLYNWEGQSHEEAAWGGRSGRSSSGWCESVRCFVAV
jgi:hypothetical protein